MMVLIKGIKTTPGINVRCICCDNYGEIEAFVRLCKQKGMCINFEHAIHSTPQEMQGQLQVCNAVQQNIHFE